MKSHLKMVKRIKKINNTFLTVFVFSNHLSCREKICFSKNKNPVVFKII